MDPTAQKIERVKQELKSAGAGRFELRNPESRYLPNVIAEDEHINAAIYGRYDNGPALLAATDKRVILLDRQKGKTKSEEFPFSAVNNVTLTPGGLSATLSFSTSTKNLTFKSVNKANGIKFSDFVRTKIAMPNSSPQTGSAAASALTTKIPKAGLDFLTSNNVAVLSTVDKNGQPSGAAVFYTIYNGFIYIATKSNTAKVKNVYANRQIALTVFDPEKLITLQLSGVYEIEEGLAIKNQVFEEILKPRLYGDGQERLPPITKLNAGDYVALRITPTAASYHDYS